MSFTLGTSDYIVICLVLSISAAIGIYFRFTGGRQRTTKEFLMAGENMHILPVALSLMATYMSAISVLGLPAETYMYGTQHSVWIIGIPFGGLLAAYGFLPVFFDTEVSTSYEYLEKRFGKTTRNIASALYILQLIFYVAVVLYAPSLALNAVTGLSTWTSVIALTVICTFYCSLGGLKAVLWTDVLQAILIYVAIASVVIKGSTIIGAKSVFEITNQNGGLIFFDFSLDFTKRYTLWNSILSGILFCVDTLGTNQVELQRMMSTGSLKNAQKSLLWSLGLIFLFMLFCFWDGVVIYANYHNCDPMLRPIDKIQSVDQLMPFAILQMFRDIPGLPGLCIAGIFSASLSTISSVMNTLAAVIIGNFIKPFRFGQQLSESCMTFIAKIIVVGSGGICLILTFLISHFRGVYEASGIVTGSISGPLFGVFAIGMFSTTANEEGIIISLLTALMISCWIGFGSNTAHVEIPTLPRSISGCPTTVNETMYFSVSNTTTINDKLVGTTASPAFPDDEERYVFPLYKVSYIWIPLIGSFVVVFVGYISSFLISFCKKQKSLNPKHYSPLVRHWYFREPESSRHITIAADEKSIRMLGIQEAIPTSEETEFNDSLKTKL